MSADIRFVVIANPRTGTNHFIDLLNSHPEITCHREVFHRDTVYLMDATRDDLFTKRQQDPLGFLQDLYGSSPTRACGFKIFMEHNDVVLTNVLHDPNIKKIVLYRPNFLAVYASELIAAAEQRYLILEHTRDAIDAGVHEQSSRTVAKAHFEQSKFAQRWRAYERHYERASQVLNETNQSYLFMTYEDFINESLFRRVFPFLGLAQPGAVYTRMKKMNSSDIVSRYVNPEEVQAFLEALGKPGWSQETFMVWSQPEERNTEDRAPVVTSKSDAEQAKGTLQTLHENSREHEAVCQVALEQRPVDTATLHEDYSQQTLLFVDYAVPQYDMYAGSRTNFMYLALLVKMGLTVKLLPADFRRVEPYSTELNRLGIETFDGEWYRENWQNWLRDNGKQIDYVFFNKPNPTLQFLRVIQSSTDAALIYQCHDLHYLRLQRNAQVESNTAILDEATRYEKKERAIFASSDVLLTFSYVEEKILKEQFSHKPILTVPLFFYEELPVPQGDFTKRRDLLFVGSFVHTPNRDAVFWFATEVFPLIQQQNPDIMLNVIGANSPKDITALKSKHIKLLGKVSEEQLQGLYAQTRLAVIPLRFGAGVKGKTIEALYHGVPVVSTAIGLEGIVGIEHVAIPRDTPADFAAEVLALYNDEKKWQERSAQGVAFVAETFTSHKAMATMHTVLASAKTAAAARMTTAVTPAVAHNRLRLIAFYLPQYHPIPENDAWWGKGFTEWHNVAKAEPLFPGHHQPHLPADLGFYDLRLEETRIAQAELAQEYGITGFCYYHYWFNGKRLLERPLEEMLKSGKPDFPFCLCWATENWTRRWDGEDQHILMRQDYSAEDDRRHIGELCRIFEDRRYMRVNGKPLFLFYRTENMLDPAATAALWRDEARRAGIGDLYLVRVESIGQTDPRAIGFDAAVEFAPDWHNKGRRLEVLDPGVTGLSSRFELGREVYETNSFHSYDELMVQMLQKPVPDYRWFRCVTPAWDNSARRSAGACVFVGSTPEKYQRWLERAVEFTCNHQQGDERLVFVNAWNEWAEGNHLEPDQKFGRAYLEATRAALERGRQAAFQVSRIDVGGRSGSVQAPSTSVADHAYLEQQLAELQRTLNDRDRQIALHAREIAIKDMHIKDLELFIVEKEQHIDSLLNTMSWRITAPLRRIHETLLRIKKRQ